MVNIYEGLESAELSKPFFGDDKICKFKTIEYKVQDVADTIKLIDNMSEIEIRDFIYQHYQVILNYDLFLESPETRKQAQRLFTNKNFLRIFLSIVGNLRLNRHETICINKLTYDYYISGDNDDSIYDLLFEITRFVNMQLIVQLSPYFGIYKASVLAMVRNSSFRAEKNVHRVNTFLVKCNVDLTTENIITIYITLFSDNFSDLFVNSMMETKGKMSDPGQLTRFDRMSSAILTILNYQTKEKIIKVLFSYGYALKWARENTIVRFPLKTSTCPARILEAINYVEYTSEDDIHIP